MPQENRKQSSQPMSQSVTYKDRPKWPSVTYTERPMTAAEKSRQQARKATRMKGNTRAGRSR